MINKIITWLKSVWLFLFPSKVLTGIDCITRLGLPGSGKTLDQTEIDVLPHLLAGEEVYCCYWINYNGTNLHYFSEFDEVENLRNCVVVFDEIGQILPARQWELEGLRVQMFFQLHRHRHCTVIANTQDVSLVSKTVAIVSNKFILCEKANNPIIDLLLRLVGANSVMVKKSNVTYQALKKMANGWEMGETMTAKEKTKTAMYQIEKIHHKELNHLKIELVHKYCPKCAMRQGTQILKEETLEICNYYPKTKKYVLKTEEYCPKHHDQLLSVRESGIYDTDHEPEVKERPITVQLMEDCPPGYTKVKSQRRMSTRQKDIVNQLKDSL